MKCTACKAPFTNFNALPLQILWSKSVITCPICNFVMLLHYNKKQQVWESLDEYEERRKGWRKFKHSRYDPELTKISASYFDPSYEEFIEKVMNEDDPQT